MSKGDNTYLRQMSAVIGKLLSDLEEIPSVSQMHPFDFDKLRKRCIQCSWDSYAIGRLSGISEEKGELQ